MTPSDDMTERDAKAAAEYDARLDKVEDRLEGSAAKAETSFKEHTAGAETDLENAEDKLAKSAQRAEAQAAEQGAKVGERAADARRHAKEELQDT